MSVFAAFVFIPEMRRLADWQGAYDPLNSFAVIPLIMLCPVAALAWRRRAAVRSSTFPLLAATWFTGFAYALLVAASRGGFTAAIFAGGQFILPISVGFWLLTRSEPFEVCYARLAHWLLVFGGVAGVYGMFQYVLAPPWDTAWMQSVGAVGFGEPVPFGIRVFGVLNSPGTYAVFLASVIVINLPFLRPKSVLSLILILSTVIGLLLSLIRSGWLAVIVGIVVYITLSPRRLPALSTLAFVVGICVAGILGFVTFIPSGFSGQLMNRLASLSDVGDDVSAADRLATSGAAFQAATDQLEGAGLGVTGGGAKLQSSDIANYTHAPADVIDNGFVSRFFEMGAVGMLFYLAALLFALVGALAAYRDFYQTHQHRQLQMAAGCIAVQVEIVVLNVSGDNLQGLLAMIYFVAVALPLLPMNRAENFIS